MKKLPKCRYCGTELSATDTVIVDIIRYNGDYRSIKSNIFCCRCWDRVKILIDERCTDCKHGDDNPAFPPCRMCAHCYMSHFEKVEDDPLRNQKLRIHYTPNKEKES